MLTKSAQTISAMLATYTPEQLDTASGTIRHIILGMKGMGALPEGLAGELLELVLTVFRKTKTGVPNEVINKELADGASEQLQALIKSVGET